MLRAAAEVLGVRHVARCQPKPVWQYPSSAAAYLMGFLGQPPVELARWKPPDQRPAPHYLPICGLSAEPWSAPLDEPIAVASRDEAVARAIELVRAADRQGYEDATGDGPFQGCDGSVAVGYRLHGAQGGMLVTLCHIYYSK